MKALIALNEPRETGYRVAQVEPENNVFPVSLELIWVDCPDDLIADSKWFDATNVSFKDFPKQVAENQPITQGAQDL